MPKLYMVFDVESIGLHGEGFAVGWVVVDDAGKELDAGRFACKDVKAHGTDAGFDWVSKNMPKLTVTHETTRDVRGAFWAVWMRWKGEGATLAADCPWPVESRFLAACVDDARPNRGVPRTAASPRDWGGPYPFIDVAIVRLAHGLDPLGTNERLPAEMPIHDPLADARQSARLLLEALARP